MLCAWWSFFIYFSTNGGFLKLQIPISLTHIFGINQTCHLTNLPKSRRNGLSIIPLLAEPVVIMLCATNKWFQPLAIEIDKQANTTNDYCMPSYLSMTWRKCSGRTKVDLCFNFSFWTYAAFKRMKKSAASNFQTIRHSTTCLQNGRLGVKIVELQVSKSCIVQSLCERERGKTDSEPLFIGHIPQEKLYRIRPHNNQFGWKKNAGELSSDKGL